MDILNPDLVAFLRKHKLASKHSQNTDYIFCTETGRPLHYRNLGKVFTKAADKAKLNPEGKRKLRFHDLRRTYGSVLAKGGCDIAWAAEQLGHSPEVFLATYLGDVDPDEGAKRGLAAIQAACGKPEHVS